MELRFATKAQSSLSEQLLSAFQAAFARTEQIFNLITKDAYWMRPIPLRHPINFYEGHLPAFAWNTLFGRVLNVQSFAPRFDSLFARGIDPRDQNAADALSIAEWPDRESVRQYKKLVHEKLFDFLTDEKNLRQPRHPLLHNGEVLWLILEHELMHQETLLYMLHQLPHQAKRKSGHLPGKLERNGKFSAPEPHQVQIPAGIARLGASEHEFPFTWDNESPPHCVQVDAFFIDAFPVTNGQFLEFIEAGGYHNPAFWTPEAWQWKKEQKREHPLFWKRTGNGWAFRDFFEDVPLPLANPVYVTLAEAQAYASFKGQVLPTEAEWHRAAFGDRQTAYPWGDTEPTPAHGNFDFQQWSTVPVGLAPSGASPFGIHDLLGNGWEWTATPFKPFPGFAPSQGYPQYSADFFDGQHYVVKGGSHFTDARLLRRSFRNWFYWHYPYTYATFRCARRS
jgi:iron(II)-dependent oxidoreductase